MHDENEFLETRFIGDDPDATARWRPCPNAESEVPGYELALSNARAVLQVRAWALVPLIERLLLIRSVAAPQHVGRVTLCAMARALRTPADVLIDLLDDPLDHTGGEGGGSRVRDADSDGVASPSVSSAAMRLCRYPRVATEEAAVEATGVPSTGGPAAPENETVVAFGAHTDTTLITVSPAAAVAALEIESPSALDGWVRPEVGADPNRDIIVFVGELMQVRLNRRDANWRTHTHAAPIDRRCSLARTSRRRYIESSHRQRAGARRIVSQRPSCCARDSTPFSTPNAFSRARWSRARRQHRRRQTIPRTAHRRRRHRSRYHRVFFRSVRCVCAIFIAWSRCSERVDRRSGSKRNTPGQEQRRATSSCARPNDDPEPPRTVRCPRGGGGNPPGGRELT